MDDYKKEQELLGGLRRALVDANDIAKDLTNLGVALHYYIGPNMSYTYLPDKVKGEIHKTVKLK